MSRFKHMILDAAESVADFVSEHAQQIATDTGESLPATHFALVQEVRTQIHCQRPAVADGRTALWRIRIQLARNMHQAGVEWDSDPNLDAAENGATICRGLAEVAYEVACAATAFHAGREIEGLGEETLKHSLRSLRVSLSRLDGDAMWRPSYTLTAGDSDYSRLTPGSLKGLTSMGKREEWRAYVRVARESAA